MINTKLARLRRNKRNGGAPTVPLGYVKCTCRGYGPRKKTEADGSVRLRRVYHQDVEDLPAIRGSLTYQPIEGLYLPPMDIDLS